MRVPRAMRFLQSTVVASQTTALLKRTDPYRREQLSGLSVAEKRRPYWSRAARRNLSMK